MDRMASIVLRDVGGLGDALEAECWASEVVSTWSGRETADGDAEQIFLPAFVRALERKASRNALAMLRALGAVGGDSHRKRARSAGDRLAARGLGEPPWSDQLGRFKPIAAALVCDEAFDDGVSLFVEFGADAGVRHTLGIYVDHNLGGLVKDVLVAGALSEVRSTLGARAHDGASLGVRELDLSEARARIEAALYMLDHTYDPPVDEDVGSLRALLDARTRTLPEGFELPDPYEELSSEQREQLLADFLASPEGERWRRDEDAEDVVSAAIYFGADYNHGGPLRWSPVVVEIFMTSWLARKVARGLSFFTRVPEVLPDWVRYAGRVRGVPRELLSDAVDAVGEFRDEMLETVDNPEAWGPAKMFAVAAQSEGVDLADLDALNAFIERYNAGLAA